jgi:hypothetical protein
MGYETMMMDDGCISSDGKIATKLGASYPRYLL